MSLNISVVHLMADCHSDPSLPSTPFASWIQTHCRSEIFSNDCVCAELAGTSSVSSFSKGYSVTTVHFVLGKYPEEDLKLE